MDVPEPAEEEEAARGGGTNMKEKSKDEACDGFGIPKHWHIHDSSSTSAALSMIKEISWYVKQQQGL